MDAEHLLLEGDEVGVVVERLLVAREDVFVSWAEELGRDRAHDLDALPVHRELETIS